MKKRYFLVLFAVVLLRMPVISQTVVWEENFLSPPSGWVLEGNWAFITGQMQMYFYPVVLDYDFSAISPGIPIPQNGGDLTVRQFLEVFGPSVSTEQCEISVISDNIETVLWSYHLSEGNWGIVGGADLSFPMAQFAGSTVHIKFRTWGPTTDAWYGWYVYNLKLSASFDNDLTALDVVGPNNVSINQQDIWTLNIKNAGMLPQSGFTVKLFTIKTSQEIGNCFVTDVIAPGETRPIAFSWTPDESQNTGLYGTVMADDDEYLFNNISPVHFVRVEPEIAYNVLVWDNDNDIETIENPETGVLEQPDAGITRALDNAGIDYTLMTTLPDDLTDWDIIFATMGCYCLS
jgi:hypothetical protein